MIYSNNTKVNWSESRFNEIKEILQDFFSSVGFVQSQMVFVACSGLHGDNIVKRSDKFEMLWYGERTLLEELENLSMVKRDIQVPLRLSITDVFKGSSSNIVNITGRINAGNIQVGETISAVPCMENAIVKNILVGTQQSQWAVAGDNVQIGLSNIDIAQLRAGDILCNLTKLVPSAKTFYTKIVVF